MTTDDTSRPDAALGEARRLLLAGDQHGLAALFEAHANLLSQRFTTTAPPYDGYFHGATLLHHVAGNPFVTDLPANIVELAHDLLERGAEVDAVTLQGPSQPDDIGWTTLGLVATSATARAADAQRALMDLLIEAGADVDARNGGALIGALYYGEGAAARYLAAKGARLDLVAAAGLGDSTRLAHFLAEGRDEPGERLAHYGLVDWPEGAGRRERLGVALIYAALHGRVEVIRMLVEAGADPNERPPFDHYGTPLHWAVMGDQPAAVRVLLEAGAEPDVRDRSFHSTPEGWARHLDKPAALAALVGG